MYEKSNMETYITICKIDSQRKFAVWLRKLKQGLCMNLEGWDGEGNGKEFQKGGDICMYAAAAAAKSIQSYPTLCNTIDGSPTGSPSLGFSRQEHWSGLPLPSPMHESEK